MNKAERSMQICSVCAKAAGQCSWSKNFTPVFGWQAKKTLIRHIVNGKRDLDIESYKIDYCPEFLYDGMCYRCNHCPQEFRHDENYANRCNLFRNGNGGICANWEQRESLWE